MGEQRDVEAKRPGPLVFALLGLGEEIEQQRAEPALLEGRRDALVTGAVARAAASVREADHATGVRRHDEVTLDRPAIDREAHGGSGR